MTSNYAPVLYVVVLSIVMPAVHANSFEDIGIRATAELAKGVPANDMLGFGIYGHYALEQDWLLGFGLDFLAYDFENPAEILGITTADPKIIDAATTATNLTLWLERRYTEAGSAWYWQAGLGVGMLDVKNATGSVQGGGTYVAATEPNTELLVIGSLGYRKQLSAHWTFDSAAGLAYHMADWKVRDLNSTTVGKVDNYTAYTLRFGVDYRF